jgi:hypothetical protein
VEPGLPPELFRIEFLQFLVDQSNDQRLQHPLPESKDGRRKNRGGGAVTYANGFLASALVERPLG